jgi:uncharacterized membrane protein
MFWAYVLAWGPFGLAPVLLNKSILSASDPMTPAEVVAYATGMFLASTGSLCVLARPYVTLADRIVTIRNPLRTYRFDLTAVESLTSGFWGSPS